MWIIFLLVILFPSLAYAVNPIDSLLPGRWVELTGTNLDGVAQSPAPTPTGSSFTQIFKSWSGGSFDTSRDRLIIAMSGGGHGYAGNEIYALSVGGTSAPAWSRLSTSPTAVPPLMQDTAHGGGGGNCETEVYDDGSPQSVHTYSGAVYLPTLDKVAQFGGMRWCPDQPSTGIWYHAADGSGSWSRPASYTSTPDSSMQAVYDPIAAKVYIVDHSTSLHSWDPASPSTNATLIDGNTSNVSSLNQTSAFDPYRRIMVTTGNGVSYAWYFVNDGTHSTGVRYTLSTTGPTNCQDAGGPGFSYSFSADRFVCWAGSTTVYTLNMDTFVWTAVTADAGNTVTPQDPVADNFITFGRWQYIKSKDAFVVCSDVSSNCYAYRLAPQTPSWLTRYVAAGGATPGRASKHVVAAYNSVDGLIYFWGGDYKIGSNTRNVSHEEMWSYNVRTGVWTLLLNQTQAQQSGWPTGRCLAGFAYDPVRKLLWMVSGEARADTDPAHYSDPPGSTNAYSPLLLYDGLWAFDVDPGSKTYKTWWKAGSDPTSGAEYLNNAMSVYGKFDEIEESMVYDAVGDRLVMTAYQPSNGPYVIRYNLSGVTFGGATHDNWDVISYLGITLGDDPNIGHDQIAIDTSRNQIIVYSSKFGKTFSVNLATTTMTVLSSVPPTNDGSLCPLDPTSVVGPCTRYSMAYDSVNDLVAIFAGMTNRTENTHTAVISDLWLFPLSGSGANTWVKSAVTGYSGWVTGDTIIGRQEGSLTFDPVNNYLVQLGGNGSDEISLAEGVGGINFIRLGGVVSAAMPTVPCTISLGSGLLKIGSGTLRLGICP